jgi:hypothetical protein
MVWKMQIARREERCKVLICKGLWVKNFLVLSSAAGRAILGQRNAAGTIRGFLEEGIESWKEDEGFL